MNDLPLDGTAYLTVRRDPRKYRGLSVAKVTSKKPTVVDADCVVVKIALRMPAAAFKPLEPSAVVVVPEELVQHPVEVIAQ